MKILVQNGNFVETLKFSLKNENGAKKIFCWKKNENLKKKMKFFGQKRPFL